MHRPYTFEDLSEEDIVILRSEGMDDEEIKASLAAYWVLTENHYRELARFRGKPVDDDGDDRRDPWEGITLRSNTPEPDR